MYNMELDLLKMEMDQTLKQAEDALNQIRGSDEPEKKAWVVELAPQTADMFARCLSSLKPPPELTLSQWADMRAAPPLGAGTRTTRHTSGRSWTQWATPMCGRWSL